MKPWRDISWWLHGYNLALKINFSLPIDSESKAGKMSVCPKLSLSLKFSSTHQNILGIDFKINLKIAINYKHDKKLKRRNLPHQLQIKLVHAIKLHKEPYRPQ